MALLAQQCLGRRPPPTSIKLRQQLPAGAEKWGGVVRTLMNRADRLVSGETLVEEGERAHTKHSNDTRSEDEEVPCGAALCQGCL